MLAGNPAPVGYELIQTQVLGSPQSIVNLSNLGQFASTYRHLQIRTLQRGTNAEVAWQAVMWLNGNTSTSSYAMHQVGGNGSSLYTEAVVSGNLGGIAPTLRIPAANGTSGAFAAGVIDILDAYSTTKNKTIRTLQGVHQSQSQVVLSSGLFLSTNAIDSISFQLQGANGNFATGSRFSIYGIRG